MQETSLHQRLGAEGARAARLSRWGVLLFAYLAASAVVALAAPREVADAVGALALFVGAVVAGSTFIRRSRVLDGRERSAWTLVGVGFSVGAFGLVAMAVSYAASGEVRAFGPADLIFILGYVGVLAGFATLPHTAGTRLQRLRVALDGLIGAVSIAAILWVLVLSDVVASFGDATPWERIVGSLYPLVDLSVFVIFMIVIVRRSSLRFDLRMLLFAVGIVAWAVADIVFFTTGVGQSFAEAEPLNAVRIFAVACFIATALIVDRLPTPREYADRRVPLWSLVAPYSAAALMLVVLVQRIRNTELVGGDRMLLLATLAVALLVIGRQGVAIRENRILVERQRSALVSSISHELRTPLTSVVGFLSILRDGEVIDEADRAEMTEIVYHQANYLERIVEDLLLLADDSPDRMALEPTDVPVADLVDAALQASSIDRTSVTREVEPGLTAHVDAERLQQVLVNLLSNAERYAPGDCLLIARGEGPDLLIEVHDGGPGVPRKHELVIWDRFERGPNRYNAKVPGSGIGLAMVDAIAKVHGGVATYRRSEILGGACFSVLFPGSLAVAPVTAIPPSATPKPTVVSG